MSQVPAQALKQDGWSAGVVLTAAPVRTVRARVGLAHSLGEDAVLDERLELRADTPDAFRLEAEVRGAYPHPSGDDSATAQTRAKLPLRRVALGHCSAIVREIRRPTSFENLQLLIRRGGRPRRTAPHTRPD
ncbi:hypothetical protein Sliba_77960 [Streptomyces nigrescens]|uniref:Uncharacterized protein n=1 Tax=Streptomyces nigrescens TaxID=1920 RepID=A0A640TTF3_STRNI|nr:hypothetical protein Sliba_77960 [Streptomyces libani subsp. libani]GGV96407.1 hypothetical protein GCM10010500_39110 [Streptomyces libani subsp. libani]